MCVCVFIVWLNVVSDKSPYKYSKHAKWQKRERSITDEEVIACVGEYETQFTDKKGNPIYRARLASGRGIKVVIAKDDPTFIITVADY